VTFKEVIKDSFKTLHVVCLQRLGTKALKSLPHSKCRI